MKILDLPINQIKWLLAQLNDMEREAIEKGYKETASLLDEGKIIRTLLKE